MTMHQRYHYCAVCGTHWDEGSNCYVCQDCLVVKPKVTIGQPYQTIATGEQP